MIHIRSCGTEQVDVDIKRYGCIEAHILILCQYHVASTGVPSGKYWSTERQVLEYRAASIGVPGGKYWSTERQVLEYCAGSTDAKTASYCNETLFFGSVRAL